MLHNPPYALDKTVPKRKFADVLITTYNRLDGHDAKMRENLADFAERVTQDPADALRRGESAVLNQVTLSLTLEMRMVINNAETVEDVPAALQAFTSRYQEQIISWAQQGETSSSSMSNVVSRATLEATAKVFGIWGLAREIERSIEMDIEESKKRFVVAQFLSLKVEEWFRLEPEQSAMTYRKLSPRKAIEGTYPVNEAVKHTFSPRDTVYLFRIPQESDRLYEEAA